jgi:hypothetical protein
MFRPYLAIFGLFLSVGASTAQIVVTVSDYPRYGTDLSPTQTEEVRSFARAIVGALYAGQSVSVSIFGNADFDAQGQAFEIRVSQDRANSADQALHTLLAEEAAKVGLPAATIQGVQTQVFANGTAKPVFAQPANEDERRANRRVDFVTTTVRPTPPVQQSVFGRCKNTMATGGQPGPTRRLTCMCNKFAQGPVKDTTYDFAASRQIPGSAGMPSLSPADWDVAIRSIVQHQRENINRASTSGQRDDDFRSALLSIDDSIGLNINNFQSQATGGAAQGVFDRLILTDITNRMADQNHVYSCYAGYSRLHHDQ